MAQSKQWWGQFEVPCNSIGRWRLGPTTLWIQRLDGEWRIAHTGDDDGSDVVEVEIPCGDLDLLALDSVARYAIAGAGESVQLRPRLADRPVVTRPERPFYVPPGETATVYLSTPVWIEVTAAAAAAAMDEFPAMRPSDTWFGPNPREGQLCYASRTSCRLRLENLPMRPHRAVSAIHVKNSSSIEFLLERMQLPTEYLEIYSHDGFLWTQSVALEYVEDRELAPLRLQEGPPRAAPMAELLTPPRTVAPEGALVRAFGSIFNW